MKNIIILFSLFCCGSGKYRSFVEEADFVSKSPPSSDIVKWSEKSIPIKFIISSDFDENQTESITRAAEMWNKAVGKKLFEFSGVQNDPGSIFPNIYKYLEDSIFGNYLEDDWSRTKKNPQVLATTVWQLSENNNIVKADIIYNSNYYSFCTKNVECKIETTQIPVNLYNVALHELGHVLGLGHVEEENDPFSIMNNALFIGVETVNYEQYLSSKDLETVRNLYGFNDTGEFIETEDIRSDRMVLNE